LNSAVWKSLIQCTFAFEKMADLQNSYNLSNAPSHYWTFGVILFLLMVLAFTRVFYNHFINDRLGAYFATRYLKQLIRKELVLYHPFSLITLVLFSMATSLVLLKATHLYKPEILGNKPDYWWFFGIAAVILVWIVGRAIILKVVQFIIGSDFGQTENRYRTVIFNQVAVYALIPVVAMAYFIKSPLDEWFILACLVILGLNYLYRIGQSLITAFTYSANMLYLFLYLCALEIVPLLIIVSVVNNRMNIYTLTSIIG
jgi:hypothetical protein